MIENKREIFITESEGRLLGWRRVGINTTPTSASVVTDATMNSNKDEGTVVYESIEQDGNAMQCQDKYIDRILSDELLELSMTERNTITEEIHGVRDSFPEEKELPESLANSLNDLDAEIDSSLREHNDGRKRKFTGLKPEHVPTNREFRLSMLRCELLDAKRAANRLLTYITLLRYACSCGRGVSGCNCGSFVAGNCGRIQMKWFTKEERAILKKGLVQLMPYRDRSGRRVLVIFSPIFKLIMRTRMKIIIYLLSEASEDVESQKRGVVMLLWPGMSDSASSTGTNYINVFERKLVMYFQNSLPMRLVAIHFGLLDSPILKFVRAVVVTLMEGHMRTRLNIITGTWTEMNYKIMCYGIHAEMIPITENYVIKTRNHSQWLQARKCVELDPFGSVRTTADGGLVIECPGLNDVLFNRGKSCQFHPGNVIFRGALESTKRKHWLANQTVKKQLAWQLMEEVEKKNGRFLHWSKPGWWVKFRDRGEIRHKIATSLRDFNKVQVVDSSTSTFRNQQGAKKRKREKVDDWDVSPDCSCLKNISTKP